MSNSYEDVFALLHPFLYWIVGVVSQEDHLAETGVTKLTNSKRWGEV